MNIFEKKLLRIKHKNKKYFLTFNLYKNFINDFIQKLLFRFVENI